MPTAHTSTAPRGDLPGAADGRWWWRRLPELALAAVVYVPLVLTQRGTVGADTKTYLYLDPGRLLADAPYLWDPGTGLGTVTHQNIGYLWPSGPFYWALEQLGLPDWLAQRLWLGTILVAAGIGVLALLRELGWAADGQHGRTAGRRWSAQPGYWNAGMALAAFAYALSPYVLDYAARISVILLPWAALPWLIVYVQRSLRRGGWRDPAVFALIVLTVGAINATSLFLVGLGPLLWLLWRWLVEREEDFAAVLGVVWRVGLLTLSVSAWWLAGLVLQGAYSVPIVRYTETYQAVAVASTTPEVLRGLGYWFFYGNDKLGQWIAPSTYYMQAGLLPSLGLPVLALTSGALVRFRRRGFFLALIVVGAVIAVGGHPYDAPSPAGAVLKAFTRSDLGLAFRSTPRAVPLIILGTSVLLGAGLNALSDRLPRLAAPAAGLAVLLVIANLPGLFIGQMVDRNLRRPESVPQYWQEAAEHLDAGDHQTRVLELPGSDFAAYRWGNTVDPITPGLIDRPFVARELIPLGSPISANLVNAIDRPLQEGTFDPLALGPLARLINAGDVVLRSDLEYERFRTPRPAATWSLLRAVPGLGDPLGFGEPVENQPRPQLPMVDEVELSTDADLPDPPPVAVFPVEDPIPIVRALPTARPSVVSGDGDGLVSATAAGLIDPDRAVLYSADLLTDGELTEQVVADGAEVIVTDSNRRRSRRWGTIRENEGYTEQAGEDPLRDDVSDARLDVFPAVSDESRTVSVQEGGASITASAYGNPVTYTPGDRAAFAMDGDPATAWKVGAFSEVTGERIRIDLDEPTTIDELTLVQAFTGDVNRWITDVRITFDGDAELDVTLDESSRAPPGQVIPVEPRTVDRVEIEIIGDTVGFRPKLSGVSAVGFAEIGLAGIEIEEFIRPPVDMVDHLGPDLDHHRLSYVLQRLRNNPAEPVRQDEEPALKRIIDLPADRSFALTGDVRLSPTADDRTIDLVLGVPGADDGGATVTASDRLAGDLAFRGRSAVDGDPDTAWTTPFARPEGQWVSIEHPEPVRIEQLDLVVVADERHSTPTRITITADDGSSQSVTLPPIAAADELGTVVETPVTIEPITTREVRVTIDEVQPLTTIDWYSNLPVTMPVAIAELGLPQTEVKASGSEEVLAECRDDLLTVDGEEVPVVLDGSVADALARRPLALRSCSGDQLDLVAGRHHLVSSTGHLEGLDVDRLVLRSPAPDPMAVVSEPPPAVSIEGETRVSYDLAVERADGPFWLALGQSRNDGWEAEIDGGAVSAPTTISGFANGWYVTPDGSGPLEVRLTWAPQRLVWIAAGWSVLAIAICLWLIARRRQPAGPAGATLAGPDIRYHSLADVQDEPASYGVAAVAVVGTLAASAVVAPPIVAATTGLAVLLALRWRRGPAAVRLAAPVLYALIGGYIVVHQVRGRFPADFAWPTQFSAVHWLGMLVVLLLAVEIGLTVRRIGRR